MSVRKLLLSAFFALTAADLRAGDGLFLERVAPLLEARCLGCHNGKDRRGGLSLESVTSALAGGDSGPAYVAGDSAESLLVRMITPIEGQAEMPQDGRPLSEEEQAVIASWIDQGAHWPEARELRRPLWWSLTSLSRPDVPPPTGKGRNWCLSAVDAFVHRRHEVLKMTPSPQADRRALARRLFFDLVGLPPTWDDVERFGSDEHPLAYERMVDRLLASPHLGERWARHWLDVVHYGETHGYDKDKPRPHAWPYRDYVIRAFNQDKPFGRFVEEQIAGDVLFPGERDGIEAMGFIAAGPWDFIGHVEVPETKIDGRIARHLDRDDMVQNVAGALLSLTVGCAQCHDHKFDPISQEDYYAMQAVFAALDRTERTYDDEPSMTLRRHALEAQLRELSSRREQGDDVGTAIKETETALAELPAPLRVYTAAVHHGTGAFRGTGPDGGRPRPVHILPRGDVRRPGAAVLPGAIACVPQLNSRFDLAGDAPESARRAALARWLTDSRQPLTFRSIANRIWLYHVGRGIVESPSDFGRMGQPPTLPELLDWLAVELRDRGGSLKRLHRLIVTSAVYRQSSAAAAPGEAEAADPENRFLWRMNRRRLEAEPIRDAMLEVAGMLDRTMGGPGYQDFVIEKPEHSPHYEYHLHDPSDRSSHRRAIYRFVVRSQTQPFMTALDCADPSMWVDRRNETMTSLQALALLNNPVALLAARRFAERVTSESTTVREQIRQMFRVGLSREPAEWELNDFEAYVSVHGPANACRVIMNCNEFVFVD